jgi:hypothetical protein
MLWFPTALLRPLHHKELAEARKGELPFGTLSRWGAWGQILGAVDGTLRDTRPAALA